VCYERRRRAVHDQADPRLGRAQVGFYGALLPNAAIWLLFLSTLVAADLTAGGLYYLARPDRGARRDAAAMRLNRSI
jgi:hypothetical protein